MAKNPKTKVIALYLPQFHRIPENDEWWGEGFTEWTNVKKAVPNYVGHLQPRIPLGENYYDLSDQNVLLNQMHLAAKYGIDGFCFYHYWFAGKKLLEKPLEEMISNDELPLNFMFCWANEPWTRTWDGDKGSKQILMAQDYGSEKNWIEHFEYLKQFFVRDEYIKVNNKPALAVYKPADINDRKEMFSVWNKLALECGFEGLFIINAHRSSIELELPMYGDAIYEFEPFVARQLINEKDYSTRYTIVDDAGTEYVYDVIDYCKLCDRMIDRYAPKNSNHYLGFFTGWDNTPRVGNRAKLIFENNTPENVKYYFEKQYRRSVECNNEFLFINAWNEWGEGAILEPDEKYKYGYLEAIKSVKDEF